MHDPQTAMGDPLKGLGVLANMVYFPMAQSSDFKRIKNSDSSDFKRIEMDSFTYLLNSAKSKVLIDCQIFHLPFIF
jgi:hypothetical protein